MILEKNTSLIHLYEIKPHKCPASGNYIIPVFVIHLWILVFFLLTYTLKVSTFFEQVLKVSP